MLENITCHFHDYFWDQAAAKRTKVSLWKCILSDWMKGSASLWHEHEEHQPLSWCCQLTCPVYCMDLYNVCLCVCVCRSCAGIVQTSGVAWGKSAAGKSSTGAALHLSSYQTIRWERHTVERQSTPPSSLLEIILHYCSYVALCLLDLWAAILHICWHICHISFIRW